MKQIFDVDFLPKAVEFLDNLDEKARGKIYYNIRKSQSVLVVATHGVLKE